MDRHALSEFLATSDHRAVGAFVLLVVGAAAFAFRRRDRHNRKRYPWSERGLYTRQGDAGHLVRAFLLVAVLSGLGMLVAAGLSGEAVADPQPAPVSEVGP